MGRSSYQFGKPNTNLSIENVFNIIVRAITHKGVKLLPQ